MKATTVGSVVEASQQGAIQDAFQPQRLAATLELGSVINQEKILEIFGSSDLSLLFGGEGMSTLKDHVVPYQFRHYADEVFEFGQREAPAVPYHYSSYQFFQANRELQRYKFINYVNTTSRGVVAHFPQFMYESILKVALNNPDFEFKVRNTPYPVTHYTQSSVQTSDAGSILFMTAVAYPLMIVSVVSYLVIERTTMLKHMQQTSGMYLSAYWIGNFIFDFFKFIPTISVTILAFYLYEFNYYAAWICYCILPFSVLPFTYVTSFLFTVDSAAQTFTMFLHFFIIVVLGSLIYLLRFAPDLQHVGDFLNNISKIIPTGVLPSAMFFEASGEMLSNIRKSVVGTGKEIDPDVWALENVLGDIVISICHFFFWSFLLFLIEYGLAQKCKRAYASLFTKSYPPKANIELDDDVKAEQKRMETSKEEFSVQV